MEKWTRHLTSGIDRIQQRTQSLLEHDGVGKIDSEAPPFEPSRDALLVEGLPLALPNDLVDRAIVVFGRLAGLFDLGVLLEKDAKVWAPRAIFQEGIPKSFVRPKTTLTLPPTGPLTVLRAPAAPLLKKLSLSNLDPQKKLSAVLISPVPEFSYLLFSTLPDVWLKDHLENVNEALARGFAE